MAARIVKTSKRFAKLNFNNYFWDKHRRSLNIRYAALILSLVNSTVHIITSKLSGIKTGLVVPMKIGMSLRTVGRLHSGALKSCSPGFYTIRIDAVFLFFSQSHIHLRLKSGVSKYNLQSVRYNPHASHRKWWYDWSWHFRSVWHPPTTGYAEQYRRADW